MKKALKTRPNQLLKAERELRGWSQKYVAEQIGAESKKRHATEREWSLRGRWEITNTCVNR